MKTKKTKDQRGAFTLIELLVVITIITLLISILLPALAQARKAAQSLQCLSNMRQMGVLTVAYANDHDGYVPLAQYGNSATAYSTGGYPTNFSDSSIGNPPVGYNWEWDFAVYSGHLKPDNTRKHPTFSLVIDPADHNAISVSGSIKGGWYGGLPTNYRYNSYLGDVGSANWQFPKANNNSETPSRLGLFLNPSKFVEVLDGNRNTSLVNPVTGNKPNHPYVWFHLSHNTNFHQYSGSIDVGRHSGSENYLFMDGHAAANKFNNMKPAQFRFWPVNSYYHVGGYYRGR